MESDSFLPVIIPSPKPLCELDLPDFIVHKVSVWLYNIDGWVHVKSLQSCPTLCNPMTVARQAPLSMGFFLQARILEWVAMPYSWGSSWPRDWTLISCIARGFFTPEPPGKPVTKSALVQTMNKLLCVSTCWPKINELTVISLAKMGFFQD